MKNYKTLLIMISVLLASTIAGATDWKYTTNGNHATYVDLSSVNRVNDYIYYNAMFYDYATLEYSVATIKANENEYSIINIHSNEECTKKKNLCSTKNIAPEEEVTMSPYPENSMFLNTTLKAYEYLDNRIIIDIEGPENKLFRAYDKLVYNKLKKNYNWPEIKIRHNKKVTLLVKINKDGSLYSSDILKTSGNTDLDLAAIEAVKSSEPFAPLPEKYRGDSAKYKLIFKTQK